MLVRRATTADIDWLLGELKQFADFLGTSKKLYSSDDEYSKKTLTGFIERHLLLVAEKPGVGLVGFIAGYVTPHLFNPDVKVLAECWWWVTPEHRKTRAGLMLLDAYTEWGKANCDWVTMCIETVTPLNERCLLKRGYRLHERSYILETE